MIVHVRYFNVLADYAGMRSADVLVPDGMTVRSFLAHLVDINTERFRRAMANGDVLNSYLRVFRNQQMVAREALDVALSDGDEIWLFPAVAGGCGAD